MSDGKVTVYSTEGCVPCDRAKEYLRENGLEVEEKDVRERNQETSGPKVLTVPIICYDGDCVYGFNPEEIDEKIIE